MKKIMLFSLPLYLMAGNLDSLLEKTIENKLVTSSSYQVDMAKSSYDSLKASYKPQINIGTTYTNTNKETASTAKSSFVSYAKVDYLLYDGGSKQNNYKAAKASVNASKENLNSLKNKLSLEVINLYYNYLSLDGSKKAKEIEIKTLEAQKNRLEKFLAVGTTTNDEVEKIISRLESARVVLSEIKLDMETIIHNLSYLTNKGTIIKKGSIIVLDEVQKEKVRADIKALEFNTDMLNETAKSIKGSNYPTLTLNDTFYKYDMNYDNSAYDSGLDTQNVLKVNLNWKIFDFGGTNDKYKSKKRAYLSGKSNYEYEKEKANVDLNLAQKAYQIARLQIKSASLALKAAMATFKSIESKYQNGLVDNVSYLEALSEKSAAISQLETAKNNLEIRKAMVVYHKGLNLWENVQ
jgi:outer membrane protein TolC